MQTVEQLLFAIHEHLDALLENASQLLEVSKGAISEEEVTELQTTQESWIQKIVALDEELSRVRQGNKSPPRGPLWKEIEDKIQTFHELNQQFINNLGVRQGLIRFELKELRKARQAMKEMRSGYGRRPAASPPRGKTKIDRRS